MTDALFDQLKALHQTLFPQGEPTLSYSGRQRKKLEDEFCIRFVQLISHPDFRARSAIGSLLAQREDYSSERLEQADFESSAQEFFLARHSGSAGGGAAADLTSLCARPGPMGNAQNAAQLRKYYVDYLKSRVIDEFRRRKALVRYQQRLRNSLGISVRADIAAMGADEESDAAELVDEVEEALPLGALPLTVDLQPERDGESPASPDLDELVRQWGIRVVNGEGVLASADLHATSAGAREFFALPRISDIDRKRLGVWGAFYQARAGTFHERGTPATVSGYAKVGEELGFGRAKTIGDTVNKKLGLNGGLGGGAGEGATLRARFFQARGWESSADDIPAARYRKLLIYTTFLGVLAETALLHLKDRFGITPRVPEYRK